MFTSKNFFIRFISVDGMLRKEVLVVITNLSQLMVEKMEESISHVYVWVNDRITTAVMRLLLFIVCGYCLPSLLHYSEPY